jgi:hypothetical protein
MRWLHSLLRGGADEVGWDDLLARVVDELAAQAHYGARGEVSFAAALRVELTVPARSVEAARGFVADPRFDREVGAALANRCDAAATALPLREYEVVAGARSAVRCSEQAPRAWQLVIEGGDLVGRVLAVAGGVGELVFGRGPGGVELVVCAQTAFVSRRAGALYLAGAQLEVAALDQGDLLAVRRGDGEVVRPARTARGRVALREGDSIELGDGGGQVVRLRLRRAPEAGRPATGPKEPA